MVDLRAFAKLFLIVGMVFLLLGGLLLVCPKFPAWLGHLPGDIAIKRKHFSFYFPVTTCLLASALLSLLLWFFTKR